jgi:putative membrane protein insertion efficiency factor
MKKSESAWRVFWLKFVHVWRKSWTVPVLVYQRTLSFDHGPLRFLAPYGACPFYPTCSAYAVEAVLRYGVVKGYFLSVGRICRCHPWTQGGVDHP